MTIAVYGKGSTSDSDYYCDTWLKCSSIESIDTLTEMVAAEFSGVVDKGVEVAIASNDVWSSDQIACEIIHKTIQDTRRLTIQYIVPDLEYLAEDNPAILVCHLIRYKGEGSLLSHLKKLDLAESLSSINHNVARGITFLSINVDLTKKGFKQHRYVALQVFAYINMLRTDGISKRHYEERKHLEELDFRFRYASL